MVIGESRTLMWTVNTITMRNAITIEMVINCDTIVIIDGRGG